MMPSAPHMSLPLRGHMSAATTTANITTTPPKLTHSIESIVGRNTTENNNNNKNNNNNNRLSTTPPTVNHKSKTSAINRNHSPIPSSHKSLSPSNQITNNTSPLSTPSPVISVPNGPHLRSYLDHNQPHPHQQPSHPHLTHHSPIGLTAGLPPSQSAISHSLMMAAAHQMTPIPQEYHQAVALYPWLLRANPFANRFHGMPFDGSLTSFLLPPFRKPKRIRTAFSPGQLLKLEQAFEKNHYVVGNERKQLANTLGLSETQVKVWFQNRRTKHKRQKQEDDESQTGTVNHSSDRDLKTCAKDSNSVTDDDEDIDLEDDDLDSDEEMMSDGVSHHHLWYQSMPSDMSQTSASMASTSTSIKI